MSSATLTQPLDAANGIDRATGWRLASPDTMAETVSEAVRVREGYRFNDPLVATVPLTATARPPLMTDSDDLPEPRDSAGSSATRYLGFAWVSGLRVNLLGDRDGDGYYRGFRLDIDVDTSASGTDVSAVIYLQLSGSRLQALHTTRSFHVEGTRRSDEYTLEIELLDDYSAGHYDLAIDIVNVYDGRLLDAVSASEFTSLGGLPLEAPDGGSGYDEFNACLSDDNDYDFDGYDDVYYYDYYYNDYDYTNPDCDGFYEEYPQNDDTVGVAYAGSAGIGLLLALSLSLFRRR